MGCGGSRASTAMSAAEVVGFEPTEAQVAGQRAAAEAITELVAKAEAEVPQKVKEWVDPSWKQTNVRGPELEQMLVSTTLLDAQYYIALHENGGVMPRWQDIPAAAKIDQGSVWRIRHAWRRPGPFGRKSPILVWTYCWYNKYHPDPIGEQLGRATPVLRAMLKFVKTMGPHMTIGVLQDYGSYPQYPRTQGEQERFDAGLKAELNRWYAHPFTPVLMVTTPASEHPLHTNRRAYDARGWTFVEQRLSSMVKAESCLWDLSKLTSMDEAKSMKAKESEHVWRHMSNSMKAGRPPMMSPERVERELREGVASGALAFTASADLDLVIGIYRRGFLEALESMRGQEVCLHNCGWGDAEVAVLVEAFQYVARHLKEGAVFTRDDAIWFNLVSNDFTDAGRAQLRAAAEGSGGRIYLTF